MEDITEAVFTEVPRRQHLNCGFRIVAYQAAAGEREVINLLAEVRAATMVTKNVSASDVMMM